MENLFEKAAEFSRQGKYEDLVSLISKMEAMGCLHPELLILKSRCVQTTKLPISAGLEEVEKTLKEAVSMDKTYFPAFVELGYFKLNVLDNAAEAIPLFDKAIEIINSIAAEAILGKANCISELKTKEEAILFIESAKNNIIESKKMKEFLNDLHIYSSD